MFPLISAKEYKQLPNPEVAPTRFWGRNVFIVAVVCAFVLGVAFIAQAFLWDYAISDAIHDHREALTRDAWLTEVRLRGRANDMFFLKTVAQDELARDTTSPLISGNLRSAITTMMLARSQYDKVFVLDLDGREILRYNWKEGAHPLHEVPPSEFQSKADRPFFTETRHASPDSAVFSPMELTKEHDQIVIPFRPVVRVSGQIVGPDGKPRALLFLNYQGEQLVRELRHDKSEPRQSLLLNAEGFWLVGPDPAAENAPAYPQRSGESLRIQDPGLWERLRAGKSGAFEDHGNLYCYENIDPVGSVIDSSPLRMPIVGANALRWTILAKVPYAAIWNNVQGLRSGIWLTCILVELVVIPLVWLGLLSRQRRKAAEYHLEQQTRILRTSEERFRLIVDNVKDYALIMLDSQGYIVSWNTGAECINGYQAKEVLGSNFSRLYPAENIKDGHPERELRLATRDGRYEEEGWRLRKDGSRYLAKVIITAIFDEAHQLRGFAKVTQDITDRKRAELQIVQLNNELEEKVELLRAIFNAANHSIIATAPDGTITAFNAGAEHMLGYRAEELIGHATPAILHDPAEVSARALALTNELGKPIEPGFRVLASRPDMLGVADEQEWTYIRKDGTRFPVLLSATAIRNSDGSIGGYLGIASDIAQRKQAEAQIRQLKDQLEDAIESLDAGFVMYDVNERLVICNRRYQELYHIPAEILHPGASYEEVIRKSILLDPEHFHALLAGRPLEDWIQERMHAVRTSQVVPHQKLNDRWVQVDEKRTRSGGFISLRTDITEIKRLEATARQQTELMRMANTSAGIGLWNYHVTSGRLQWDERMLEMYGYTRESFPGVYAGWCTRLHPEDRASAEALLAQCIANRSPYNATFRLLLPNGEVRHIDASAAFTEDTTNHSITMVGVNLDITNHITRESRLQQALIAQQRSAEDAIHARQLADTASRAKAEFLATMSHEIRTPMNGVIGMTSLLIGTKLSGEQREYVDAIRISGDALLTIINDILDFSKIEAGKMTIEAVPFDLRTAIEDVIELLGSQANEKGIDLLLDYPGTVVSRLIGDDGRVRQIMLNLIGNALKFTAHGAVTVSVAELARRDLPPLLRITVRDSGIGMTQDQVAMLFKPFTQADASTSRRFGGTGLGLAICARLCALMNGVIRAESTVGVGSSFIIELPVTPDPQGDSLAKDHDEDKASILRDRPVLVISDRKTSGGILTRTLEMWGMQATCVEQVHQAIGDLRSSPGPKLVIFDQQSVASASALLLQMRGMLTEASWIPVLIVARGGAKDLEQATALGFSTYLTRPLRSHLLRQSLICVLNAGNQPGTIITRRTLAESTTSLHRRPDEVKMKGKPWRALVAEDNTINQRVARRLLERMGCLVDIAANGIEAVDLAGRAHYDIIFMDCQMPELDGMNATRQIRGGSGPCHNVPIIALTANAMERDRDACLAAGMDDHLAKPINAQALSELAQRWLGADRTTPASVAIQPNVLCELQLQMGDRQTVIEMIDMFLTELPRELDSMRSILAAEQAAGIDRIRRIAHGIKSSSAILGARQLTTLCDEVEHLPVGGDCESCAQALSRIELETCQVINRLKYLRDSDDWNV